MKKLLYLFVAAAILISCESNEDDPSSDPIIGKWQVTSYLENGQEQATDCDKKSIVTFNSDGTFSNNSFYTDDSGNCVSDSDSYEANWKNIGNSTYSITDDDEVDEDDLETVKIEFSENNSVFSITTIEEYNGTINTYKDIYKKI